MMIGDILIGYLGNENTLVADGSQISEAEYPELVSLLKAKHTEILGLDTINTAAPTFSGVVRSIRQDGNYAFVSGDFPGNFAVISLMSWAVVTGTPTFSSTIRSIAFDANYIYLGGAIAGGIAIINRSNWSLVATPPTVSGAVYGITQDADNIYVGGTFSGGFAAFAKGTWAKLSGTPTFNSTIENIHADGTHIFVVGWFSNYFAAISKETMTVVKNTPAFDGGCYGVYADDQYVYVAGNFTDKFAALNKVNFNRVPGTPTFTANLSTVVSDEHFVYVGGSIPKSHAAMQKSDWHLYPATVTPNSTAVSIDVTANHLLLGGWFSGNLIAIEKRRAPTPGFYHLPRIPPTRLGNITVPVKIYAPRGIVSTIQFANPPKLQICRLSSDTPNVDDIITWMYGGGGVSDPLIGFSNGQVVLQYRYRVVTLSGSPVYSSLGASDGTFSSWGDITSITLSLSLYEPTGDGTSGHVDFEVRVANDPNTIIRETASFNFISSI